MNIIFRIRIIPMKRNLVVVRILAKSFSFFLTIIKRISHISICLNNNYSLYTVQM